MWERLWGNLLLHTHEHTNFLLLKLCKKLYRNLTESQLSFFIASSSSISSLPCSSNHFPSSAQTVQFLSSTLTHFPPLSSPFHCCLILFFLSVFTPNIVVFIISFPLPPFISFCPLSLPPLSLFLLASFSLPPPPRLHSPYLSSFKPLPSDFLSPLFLSSFSSQYLRSSLPLHFLKITSYFCPCFFPSFLLSFLIPLLRPFAACSSFPCSTSSTFINQTVIAWTFLPDTICQILPDRKHILFIRRVSPPAFPSSTPSSPPLPPDTSNSITAMEAIVSRRGRNMTGQLQSVYTIKLFFDNSLSLWWIPSSLVLSMCVCLCVRTHI